jgi:PAS domain S-box-containing protein
MPSATMNRAVSPTRHEMMLPRNPIDRRTSELTHKARADRIEVLLAINERNGQASERDFLTFGLEAAERLTTSQSGFLHFVNDDQESLELITWTANARQHCTAAYDNHYPLSSAGIWAACFNTRAPFVCNDYAAATGKKGLPEGHVSMTRLLSVPVIEGEKVRMILGVGNKESDYSAYDVETLQLIGNDLWRIAHAARVERSLAASLEKFHSIFNTVSEGIFLHDEAGHILDANVAVMQMYGYNREELGNIEIADLSANSPGYSQHEALQRIGAALAGEPQWFEWQARRKDGTLFWVDVNLKLVTIGGQNCLLAVVADISERKQFQEAVEANVKDLVALNTKLEDAHLQLLQSEKMASIGQLAAGVAHEINNPVGFVFSNLGSLDKYLVAIFSLLDAYEVAEAILDTSTQDRMHALRQELDIDFLRQDIAALLGETREGINRVRKIVQDLKDFSRVGSEDDWQWLDVHVGLESTLTIVWNELKYKTTVDKQYGQLPQIYGLPSQLNQVFMNLLVNAAHAIDTKGVVTIRTGQQDAEVWIEVEDTGCGIPAENLKRIFDPFFTTKPVGKGTGLGLSVSYTIVQKHHGRIEIRSEVGKGTTFRVCLPINPPEPADNTVPATGHFIPPAPTLEHS